MDILIRSLLNSSSDIVYKSLVTLRKKYLRPNNFEAVKLFRENDGLKNLLPILRKPNSKLVNVALSIVGNCCLEKESRDQIKNLKAVPALVTILKSLESDEVQNRVCRTLGNLSLDKEIAETIHNDGAVKNIVEFLVLTKNPLSQQSAVRALRRLANNEEHRDSIVNNEGVRAIAALLNTESRDLLLYVLKALAHLTWSCTVECAHQVESNDGITAVVTHAQNNGQIQDLSMTILTNLVCQAEIRPFVGNAGAIPLFIQQANQYLLSENEKFLPAVTALGLCCREAINRLRIRENGGLKTLIQLMKILSHGKHHDEIIGSIINFLYDEKSFEVMLELDLGSTLISKLNTYVKQTLEENCNHEIEDPNKINVIPIRKASCIEKDLKQCIKTSADYATFKDPTTCRKRSCDSDEMDSRKEAKTQQTYRINSPSYQQVQHEILSLGIECSSNFCDDAGQWSPTNTNYSPVQSPPDWRQGQHFPPSTSWQNSPGGFSPESEDRLPGMRRGSEDELILYSRSPSPMSASPVGSPPPEYACYSPVCDEASDQEEPPPQEIPEKEPVATEGDVETSNSSITSDVHDEDEMLELFNEGVTEIKKSQDMSIPQCYWEKMDPGPTYIHNILMILSRITHMEKPHTDLLTGVAIDTLLAIIVNRQYPITRAVRILIRLARNPLCFEALVAVQFPQKIALKLGDDVLQHSADTCRICSRLRTFRTSVLTTLEMQAESPFGIGTITRLLSLGNDSDKISTAISLPYLVVVKSLRQKALIQHRGLELILEVLKNPLNEKFQEALNSVLKICLQMELQTEILNPCLPIDLTMLQSKEICKYVTGDNSKDVTFVLDSCETVSGNRKILSGVSDVFAAMLDGGFKEATQAEVKFSDISKVTLEFIMHYLHGCEDNYCPTLRNADLELLLDTAIAADKFLLAKLKEYIQEVIMKNLNSRNAASIYSFAHAHNYVCLASSVLNLIFGPSFHDERTNFFSEILATKLNEIFLAEIKQRITEHLNVSPMYVSL